jgi:hypothetical protein
VLGAWRAYVKTTRGVFVVVVVCCEMRVVYVTKKIAFGPPPSSGFYHKKKSPFRGYEFSGIKTGDKNRRKREGKFLRMGPVVFSYMDNNNSKQNPNKQINKQTNNQTQEANKQPNDPPNKQANKKEGKGKEEQNRTTECGVPRRMYAFENSKSLVSTHAY